MDWWGKLSAIVAVRLERTRRRDLRVTAPCAPENRAQHWLLFRFWLLGFRLLGFHLIGLHHIAGRVVRQFHLGHASYHRIALSSLGAASLRAIRVRDERTRRHR